MAEKWIYLPKDGNKGMKFLLGGKGANLCQMWNMGFAVPPFFIATTDGDIYYLKHKKMPPGIENQIEKGLKFIEKEMGKEFGNPDNPLLLSVRSGSAFSMPGMMDTVLNLGLNKVILAGLIKKTGNERFGWDCWRRLLQMFGDVVLGVDKELFEKALEKKREDYNVETDPELPVEALMELAAEFETFDVYSDDGAGNKKLIGPLGKVMPEKPMDQLMMGIEAVYKSWNTERAIAYRNAHRISHNLGTAVNIQAMVFGNVNEKCGSGVMFTRNPSNGRKELFAEFLFFAQGEEVVAGTRNPMEIKELKKKKPKMYKELLDYSARLEKEYKDMQDIEFTFEGDKLYILQTRNGKRTGPAAVRVASDMHDEGLITKNEALLQVDANLLVQCLLPRIRNKPREYKDDIIGKGLKASPGAAVGQIVFSTAKVLELVKDAEAKKQEKPHLILVRHETNPDDFPGMHASDGILTSHGGMTSHAAVVARQMGKPCVAGCRQAVVNYEEKTLELGGVILRENDIITIDGTKGEVINRELDLDRNPKPTVHFYTILDWANDVKRLGVRANADKEEEAALAVKLGVEGIGLCRTEHQFGGERKQMVSELILILSDEKPSEARIARKAELIQQLLDVQREDFIGVFKAMKNLPTTIRLIDPPLHEFLLTDEEIGKKISDSADEAERKKYEEMAVLREAVREANPMLGIRGCRLGLLYPIIIETQVRAVFEAACILKKGGHNPDPEIMIPLTMDVNELNMIKPIVTDTAAKVFGEKRCTVSYKFGTMIEIPRACMTADEIGKVSEFFSFGTNDLTQTGMGLSRDDTAELIRKYVDMGILPVDPFDVLDQRGIGRMMRICIEDARSVNPKIKLGICGEHGGQPDSVEFCHKIGLDYVSCSPFRVPGARLSAAQAVLKEKKAAKESEKAEAAKASSAKIVAFPKAAPKTTSKPATAKKAALKPSPAKKAPIKKAPVKGPRSK